MGEATLENEALIEEIFIDYSRIDDSEKAKVTNYDKLDDARNAVTKLYHTEEKDGPRFDRSKIQIGTYCLYNTSEERIKWLNEAGIDFVAGAPYNHDVLDLFSKYDVGAFISYLPGWYGGDGSNAGGFASAVPSGAYNSYAENFVDHPAIWAVDVGDEPNAAEFPHYGIMIEEAKALFPNQLVYLNLYPNYASKDQEGTDNYEGYIQVYTDNVNTDYISFDFYNIVMRDRQNKDSRTGKLKGSDHYLFRHLENLRIVANACRETGRDMWTVIQANALSDIPLDYLSVDQLNVQVYTALAFGSQVINWACWENGWYDYDTNMITGSGERTPVYYRVAEVNKNIKNLSPVYMRYENTDAAILGNTDFINRIEISMSNDKIDFVKNDGNVLEQEMFQNIKIAGEESKIITGSFVKRNGDGDAILFANTTDFFAKDAITRSEIVNSIEITFTLKDADRKVVIYYPELAYVMEPDENGVYRFSLENTDGVFITAEPVAKTAE